MSESENKPQAKVDNRFNDAIAEDVEKLQASVQSLQSVVFLCMILMLVFTVCLNLYLGVQVMSIRDQAHRELATAEEFQKNKAPAIAELWGRLSDFGTRHPDFKPVLVKYNQYFKDHGINITPAKSK